MSTELNLLLRPAPAQQRRTQGAHPGSGPLLVGAGAEPNRPNKPTADLFAHLLQAADAATDAHSTGPDGLRPRNKNQPAPESETESCGARGGACAAQTLALTRHDPGLGRSSESETGAAQPAQTAPTAATAKPVLATEQPYPSAAPTAPTAPTAKPVLATEQPYPGAAQPAQTAPTAVPELATAQPYPAAAELVPPGAPALGESGSNPERHPSSPGASAAQHPGSAPASSRPKAASAVPLPARTGPADALLPAAQQAKAAQTGSASLRAEPLASPAALAASMVQPAANLGLPLVADGSSLADDAWVPVNAGAGERSGGAPGRDSGNQGSSGYANTSALPGAGGAGAHTENLGHASEFADVLDSALGAELAGNETLVAVMEPLGHQISLWSAGQTKRAQLMLHDGLQQTLQIELHLDRDQARLDFYTDDASLRETLLEQAREVLAEMLGRNGLELAGLSVGARNAGQSDARDRTRPELRPGERVGTLPVQPEGAGARELAQHLRGAAGRAGLSIYV